MNPSPEMSPPPDEDTRTVRRCDVYPMLTQLDHLAKGSETTGAGVRSLAAHLGEQDRQAETLARSLSALAKSMRMTTDVLRGQLETSSMVRTRMDEQAERFDRIDDRLSSLDQLTAGQSETQKAIDRLREQDHQADERVKGELEQPREAVFEVAENLRLISSAFDGFRAASVAREERLVAGMEQRVARYTVILWTALGIALATGVIGLIVAWVK